MGGKVDSKLAWWMWERGLYVSVSLMEGDHWRPRRAKMRPIHPGERTRNGMIRDLIATLGWQENLGTLSDRLLRTIHGIRCGHMNGKRPVIERLYYGKIRRPPRPKHEPVDDELDFWPNAELAEVS